MTGGKVIIKQNNGGDNRCIRVVGAAYLTVDKGAEVTLKGVGFDANGAHQRSVIENNGGVLTIIAAGKESCRFSNERKNIPLNNGILVNRNDGTTLISGVDFVDSSAKLKGGAIGIDSGTVTINDSASKFVSIFNNNHVSDNGGAIFVGEAGRLIIASSNFEFKDNRADHGGGAIFSDGVVEIKPGTGSYRDASFARNQAQNGGAIYNDSTSSYYYSGRLSVDGVEFEHNVAKHDGGAVVSNEALGDVASIKNSYFHNNSAKDNGGAVYVVEDSEMEVRGSTFLADRAGPQGGGIYVAPKGKLTVVNSTFVGRGGNGGDEGVVTNGASGQVVFSTLLAANLASFGAQGQVSLSNSILQKVSCTAGMLDDAYNMQFLSKGCPNSIPTENPTLDRRGLANNGGPTPTIALLSGSPAIDAIPYGDCVDQEGNRVTTDQRGFHRPDHQEGFCDMGAYEFQDKKRRAQTCGRKGSGLRVSIGASG